MFYKNACYRARKNNLGYPYEELYVTEIFVMPSCRISQRTHLSDFTNSTNAVRKNKLSKK